MADKDNIVHPYYNHNYARYDLNIDDVIAGLKRAGYMLDDDETGDEEFEDVMDPSLRLEVLSTRGTVCNNTGFNTVLYPRLYKNNIDVTDSIPPVHFKWQRISGSGEEAQKADAEWNLRYAAGSKECYLTRQDIRQNSTFVCKYVEFEDQDVAYVNAAYRAYIKNKSGGDI